MAAYDVLFPVRARVLERFSRQQIEMAAEVAFWQHPPDGCIVIPQQLTLEWTEVLLDPGAQLIRVSGDVIPQPADAPDPPIRTTSVRELRKRR